jgi:glycosyltransferase involved in cell wall biosynthesis
MKVLIATESFLPLISGVSIAAKNLAFNLAEAGHEAFVVTPGTTNKIIFDKKYSAKYSVYRVPSLPNPFRPGFRITSIKQREADELIDRIKPDIIHLQDPAGIGQAFRKAGKNKNIPVIITNHFSLEFALSYVRFLGPLLPLAKYFLTRYLVSFYDQCDKVVTPTETFKKELISWGVKAPVYAVSNGIYIDQFLQKEKADDLQKLRLKFNLPNRPTILYLGRVDKDKSIDVLVKAMPIVLQACDAHFIVAGKGGEVANIQAAAARSGISQNLTMIGFIDHNSPDFARLYKNASLFAIPSTIETQSLVTLEAMSSGLPIVAADANALPEIVHNGKNGYLFRPGDDKELAKKIIRLIKNKELAKKFGQESRKIALHHAMPTAFAEMIGLYHLAIEHDS